LIKLKQPSDRVRSQRAGIAAEPARRQRHACAATWTARRAQPRCRYSRRI